MSGIWKNFVRFTSGEWILRKCSNGGDVILARAVLITFFITFPLLELKELVDPTRRFAFSIDWRLLSSNLGILGAVFAASYTALYTRFSSQWNYLANLYNQQMEVGITADEVIARRKDAKDAYHRWLAAFVEDSWSLHLAGKPMFSEAIRQLLETDKVCSYVKSSLGDKDFDCLRAVVGLKPHNDH